MKTSDIFIVIAVHNRLAYTRACLHSLQQQSLQGFNVIVVDDGSSDGTAAVLRDEFPYVSVLRGDGNLWWTAATNLGVKYALKFANDNGYVLTLNNDTTVQKNYLELLLDCSLKCPRSLIGSIAVSDQDRSMVLDAGIRINWLSAKYDELGKGEKYEDILKSKSLVQEVDVLPGRGTLIPIEAFREVGFYNDRFLPHYGADYEFSHRAKMNGYNLLVNYQAVVIGNVRSTGLNNRVNKLKWRDLARSLFTIRSANSLKYRWNFARLCCTGWRFPLFYLCDTGRLIMGSFLSQIRITKNGSSPI